MKYVVLAALLLPSLSFACGGTRNGPVEGYQGDKAAINEITRKSLTCDYFGVVAPAQIDTWAMYRCLGSPFKAELSGFGEKIQVTDVKKEGASYRVLTDRADTSLLCHLN